MSRWPSRSRGSSCASRAARSTSPSSPHRSSRPMALADVPVLLILVGIAAYIVFAGADFGAGLWYLLAGAGPKGRPVPGVPYRGIAPRWPARHRSLVFVLL